MDFLNKLTLDRARATNLGHRMIAVSNDFASRILECYRQQGYDQIRGLHGALFRNLELDGTRLTTLAARAGITHRAMAKIVDDVERLGFLSRATDPVDRRATLIQFTDKGLRLLKDSSAIIEQIYADYSAIAGAEVVQHLEHRLYSFLSILGVVIVHGGQQALHSPRPAVLHKGSSIYLSHNVGRYLQLASDDYQYRCSLSMARRGHPGVRFDHLAVLTHLSLDGMNLTDLADSAAISPQAMGKQARTVQKLGYVTIATSASDRRVRFVSFTQWGLDFLRALLASFEEIDREYAEVVGKRKIQLLHSSLARLVTALNLEVPVRSINSVS